MIQRLASLLLCLAAASFLANGAQALTGASASASSANSPVDASSIEYVTESGLVAAVSFRLATAAPVQIRVSANDRWFSCTVAASKLHCPISPRPVTDVNRLEIKTS